jgi:hypothetical protein
MWTVDDGFDLDGFLGQPLVARSDGRTDRAARATALVPLGRASFLVADRRARDLSY